MYKYLIRLLRRMFLDLFVYTLHSFLYSWRTMIGYVILNLFISVYSFLGIGSDTLDFK